MREIETLKRQAFGGVWLRLFCLLVMAGTMAAFGQDTDNLAKNPFGWKLPPGYSVEEHAGRNGQPGLVVRSGKPWYQIPLEGVRPLQKYRYGTWVKTKDLKPGVRGATAFVTFLDEKGNFSEADAPIFNGYIGTRDWTYIEQEVTAPAKFERVTLNLYIGQGEGEAVFSEPFFKMDRPIWVTKMIRPAMRFGVEEGKQEFEFNSFPQNVQDDVEREAKVVIVDGEGKSVFETQVPVENHRYCFEADLAEGKYVAKLTLLPANLTTEVKMNVVKPRKEARVTLDEKGRFIVKGKPFLPIGIYTNMEHLRVTKRDEKGNPIEWDSKFHESDMKLLIEDSPYNVLLPYDSFWWDLEKPELKGFEATQYMLDLMEKHNKMLILSVKDFHPDRITKFPNENLEGPLNITRAAVERFRDHPAVLAWYVNDECDVAKYEAEQAELVGQLDPNHPSLQVQYRPNLQFSSLDGGDLIGLDIYPLNGADSTQEAVCDIFQSANDGFRSKKGLALCAVPQIFSWYIYTHSRAKHLPTVEQMRAVTLMMAAYGAKSFVFFAHTSLIHTPEHFEDVTFEKVWSDGCAVANTVKELEPYILGEADYVTPPMTVNSGEPVARVLTADNGRQAVIITTVGKGTTDVVVQLDPKRQFRSKYGKTKALGEGKYQFTCEKLDCDVLEEEEIVSRENLLVNPFRQELLPNDGYVIDPHAGRNGTQGLIVNVPGSWYGVPIEGIQPMQKYKYGVWIKTKDLVPGVRGATMFLSFMKDDGSWNEADAPLFGGFIGTKDWTYFEQEVTAPAKFHHVMMNFYIGHGKGEAVFSEPFIRREAPSWATTMIYPTMRFGLVPGKQTFEFNSYPQNINEGDDREAKVVIEDAVGTSVFEAQVPVTANRYRFDADLSEGSYLVKMTLLPANLKSELKIRVVPPRENASVKLDGRGRFTVNGKLFLPIGIYTNMDWGEFKPYDNKWREYDTKTIIEDSPFNVLLPYDGLWWKLEKPDLKGFAATQHMLDVLQKNNKMMILSVKDYNPKRVNNYPDENLFGAANITKGAVERFRDHPALLAWYMNDESEVEGYEAEQVELVGSLDPYHPTLQVQYRPNLQFSALNGGDIVGLDIYPIRNVDSNQKVVCDIFQSIVDGFGSSHGVVVCAVPQMFAWHAYSERIFKYKPTLAQMRAVTLMMAAYGARSFIFYAHQGLVKMVKPFEISFEDLWKEACELAQTVADLEDYLLGEPLPFAPECEVKSGNPVVQVLTSNAGKQAVMVTTTGDTKTTEVVIQLDPNRQFRSKYGKTKALGEGKFQFTCEYMDCDVLEEY